MKGGKAAPLCGAGGWWEAHAKGQSRTRRTAVVEAGERFAQLHLSRELIASVQRAPVGPLDLSGDLIPVPARAVGREGRGGGRVPARRRTIVGLALALSPRLWLSLYQATQQRPACEGARRATVCSVERASARRHSHL